MNPRAIRLLRRIGLVFLAWALGFGAVALYLNHYDWNRARPLVARYSKKYLGREVRVGGELALRLGVHPILIADKVTVENAAWAGTEPAFSAGHLEIKLDLWPAFRNVLQIPYIRLKDARILVATRGDGTTNFNFSEEKAGPARDEKPSTASTIDAQPLALELTNVALVYTAAPAGKEAPKPWRLDVARLVAVPVGAGDLQIEGEGKWDGLPAQIRATAKSYLPALRGKGPLAFAVRGRLGELAASADGGIGVLQTLGDLSVDATVKGRNAQDVLKAFGVSLNDDLAAIDVASHIAHDGDTWTMTKASIRLGPSRATGELAVTLVKPLRIVAKLHATTLRFADLGAFLPKSVAAELPATKKAESRDSGEPVRLFSAAPIDMEAIRRLDLDAEFAVDHFVGTERAALIDAFKGHVSAKGGKLELRPFEMALANGTFATDFALDTTERPAKVSLVANLQKVQLGRLLEPFLVSDETKGSSIGNLKTNELFAGRLNGRIDLTAAGASVQALMASLDGDLGLVVEDGKMSSLIIEALGMDATEAIGTLFAKKQTVAMECLITSLAAKQGEVSPRVMLASTKDSNVVLDGKLDLRKETVDAVIKTFPKDFSIGVLRTPLTLKGPLYKVKVDVMRKELGVRLLTAAGLGAFLSPVAALLPLIEPGLEKDGKCTHYLAEIRRIEQGSKLAPAH